MKKFGLYSLGIIMGIVVITIGYFGIQGHIIQDKMYSYLETYYGYTQQDIQQVDLNLKFSGTKGWYIFVEFKKEPKILYGFIYHNNEIIKDGVAAAKIPHKEFIEYENMFENGDLKFNGSINDKSIGIIHNSENGTITLDNGEESITIMDRNLGAEVAGTGSESFGYYFQWGNNHGFQLNSEIKTGKDLVKRDVALQYGPNNPYDSDVQFVIMDNSEEVNRNLNLGNYFLAAVNDNLRGGSGDNEIVNRMGEYVIDQFRGDTGNPRVERQGPCPEGFHVPSLGEIHKLLELWIDIKYPDDTGKKEQIRWMVIGGGGLQLAKEFSNDLLLPMAGGIRFDGNGTPHDQGSEGYYWMSSPGKFLYFHSYMIAESTESYRAATFPVRCFKN